MIVWVSHVKVEHRQGLIKETRCRNAAGFLRYGAEFSHHEVIKRKLLRKVK